MDSSAVIEVQNLRKTYRDGVFRKRRIEALRGVTLDVPRGEIFGLLGPNGAGKTTLIKILLGIVRKSEGSALLLGRPAGNRQSRQKVGYLPEGHRLPHHLTGNTALEYYGGLSGLSPGEVRQRRGAILDTVGLADWGRTSVRKYSKGMLQRLGLAQAMLHDPDLLILDEPTDGVDPVGRTEIRRVLVQLKSQGKTVFLNSHLLQELELVCDRVAILDHGQVRRIGAVRELTEGNDETRFELVMNLEGPEAAIREALGRSPTAWNAVAANRFQVTLPVGAQLEVDTLIDALRGRQVSIYAISRRKITLEEAFIEIVGEAPRAP